MTDYARFKYRLEYSTNSDYSAPTHTTGWVSSTATPDRVKHGTIDVDDTPGNLIYDHSVEAWGTLTRLYVLNESDYEVTVSFNCGDGSTTAASIILAAGDDLTLSSLGAGDITLVSATARAEVTYWLEGSA